MSDEVSYSLRRRAPVDYFGDDSSEEEDPVEEDDEVPSEQECNEITSNSGDEDQKAEEEQSDTSAKAGRKSFLKGKDGTKWSTKPSETRGRHLSSRIHFPTPTQAAINIKNPLEAWRLFFTSCIVDIIVTHTNEEIRCRVPTVREHRQDLPIYRETDSCEIEAFLGLLYYAGVTSHAKQSSVETWCTDFGMNLFVSVMSRKRFEFLASVLRFDNKETRKERRENDLLAPRNMGNFHH